MRYLLLASFLLYCSVDAQAQAAGNQLYGNRSNYNAFSKGSINRLSLTDSTFLIEARVLKNVRASSYVAVFSLSGQGSSIAAVNEKLEKQAARFITAVKNTGIKDHDIYTDILTQSRVYDFRKTGTDHNNDVALYEEYLAGFESGRNVIVRYQHDEQLSKLVALAANEGIFDLAKVDYLVDDVSKLYDELFALAGEVIKKKKSLYTGLTDMKLKPGAQVLGESFYSYAPPELYKQYEAFDLRRDVKDNSGRTRKTEMEKFRTFYYDKPDHSGFDKIINPSSPEPMIGVVMVLQVKYEVAKQ